MDGTLPVVTVGGGGGGGGSYISSVAADRATTLAGNGSAVEGQRNAGSITITYGARVLGSMPPVAQWASVARSTPVGCADDPVATKVHADYSLWP